MLKMGLVIQTLERELTFELTMKREPDVIVRDKLNASTAIKPRLGAK